MEVKFVDDRVRGRCEALIALDEVEYRKIRVKNGHGRYLQFLMGQGFIEQLHPFRPVNEYNSYRLTEMGSKMKKVLLNILGR